MTRRVSLVLVVVAMLRSDFLFAKQDAKKPIRPGETGSVTLTVAGTTKPVHVRVHNQTPDIVTVAGGNDQIVMSSGGDKNTVTLQLTGVSSGEPSFSMEVVDNTDLDAVFRRTLRKVIGDTRKRVAALETIRIPSGRATYRLADVLDVLQRVVSDIDVALPDHEFAPFRDAIDDYVATLRGRVTERAIVIPQSSMTGRFIRAVVTVSYRTVANTRAVEKESADSIFGEAVALLDRTAERGSTRELCVRTTPTLYEITIYPRSYPPDAQTVTAASMLTVTVGKYKHRIRAQGKNIESSGDLDFLLNTQSAIECPVKFNSGDPEACRYVEVAAKPCK